MNCTAEERVFRLSVFSLSFNFHLVLFFGILLIYLISVSGNLVIIGLVYAISHLHTPMYYFLCNLSVQDIVYVSATLPKFLYVTISGNNRILFPECITLMFFFTFCVGTVFFFLTFMAYDRYAAICLPLSCEIIMNPNLCVALCSFSWLVGFCISFSHAVLVSSLSFCHSQDISHFYCDLKAMIELSSSDVSNIETMVSLECIFLGVIPFGLIFSFLYLCNNDYCKYSKLSGKVEGVLQLLLPSYRPHIILLPVRSYLIPQSENSKEQTKMLSLLYTAIVPMLNPLVYSLRNKQVLKAADLVKKRYLKC